MKFSIITPTYNRAHTIERAINSLLQQTYENWEMIIVDDGSTDNTEEVVNKFIQKDKRIKYIKLDKNSGVNKARNIGFENISADSEWIGFLDSDDVFVEDALEKMANKVKEFPDFRHFAFSTIYETGREGSKIPYDNYVGDYESVLGKNNGEVEGEFNTLLHRSIIEEGFRFEENVNGYEWIGWLRLAKSGVQILYTTTTTRIYITSGESLIRTKNKSKKYYENAKKGLEIILDEFGEDLKKVNRKKYAKYLSWYGYNLIRLGNTYNGIRYTIKSFFNNPFEFRNIKNILIFFKRKEKI